MAVAAAGQGTRQNKAGDALIANNPIFIASADEVIEQILVQCWVFEARDGNRAQARLLAERTLERLLSAGLPFQQGGAGMLLDPYAANNRLKTRAGERADQAWTDWQRTAHRNALSLPTGPHRYRFMMRREWHGYSGVAGRPVVLRLPLPLRQSQLGPARVRLLEPDAGLLDLRESPGRVELRVDPGKANGPIVAELAVDLVSGEVLDTMAPAAMLGQPPDAADQVWMRTREGYITPSAKVAALAAELAAGCGTAREFAYNAWHWLMKNLQFGDVHREQLNADDALGGLLGQPLADCMLGSSLLVGLCRERGIPARLVTGYLLHPANLGPHSWAEVRLAPGLWVPFDFGSWCYCAGDPSDSQWGNFFRGRVDARFVAEVAPREFTGWGSAPPPARWYRLERLRGNSIEHTLHALPDGSLFRRDTLDLELLGAAKAPAAAPSGRSS